MSCCGKARNIAKGYSRLITDGMGITEKQPFTDGRIERCCQCGYSTWLSKTEYTVWLASHGIRVLENIDQLEALPVLPRQKRSESRQGLYCRICKCYLPAKANVEDEDCIMGSWLVKKGRES